MASTTKKFDPQYHRRIKPFLKALIPVAVVGLILLVGAYYVKAVACTPGGTNTTTLALCKPAAGETGWAAAINGNWDAIDALFSGASILKVANGGTGLGSPGASGNALVSNGTAWTSGTVVFDPEATDQFYEEFITCVVAGADLDCGGGYWVGTNTAPAVVAGTNGVGEFVGGGAAPWDQVLRGTNTTLPWVATKNPIIKVREAQVGADASTRRFGLADGVVGAADPANGLWFSHGNAGAISFNCRKAAGAVVTTSTGTNAAIGTFHSLRAEVSGTSSVSVYVDGTLTNSGICSSASIPTVNLAFRMGENVGAASGMDLDYVFVKQDR